MVLKQLSSADFSSVVDGKISGAGGGGGKVGKSVVPKAVVPKSVEPKVEPKAVVDNTGETGGFNFEEAVRSPYGMSELNNYLYDSGLQNVFKDYQENIASLNASEQQNLEDAYYIREMSKKYLGEYASNTGIGDVSGNLLDIYGNYQQNKADIKANYDALELNLTQTYRAEKTSLFNEKMKEQYNMELADFAEGSQEIMFNAVTGGYDTELYADEWEYLDAMKASGDLSTSDYQMAYGSMYSSMLDRIQTNLQNGNYEGFENAEEYINSFGKLIAGDKSMLQGISNQIDKQNQKMDIIKNLITGNYGEGVEGLDYLESVREIIGPEAYQQHYLNIYANLREEAFGIEGFNPETMTADEYVKSYVDRGLSTTDAKDLRKGLASVVERHEMAKIDTSIGNQDSETYVGDDYNFHVNTGGENVDKGSYMYQDAYGNKTFAVSDDSEKDGEVSGWYASHENLMKTFRDKNDGKDPLTGQEVEFSAYNEETKETQTFSYVYQNGRWHRLVQENHIDPTDMAFWKNTDGLGKDGTDRKRDNGRKVTSGEGFKMDNRQDGVHVWALDFNNWDEPDIFEYKGKTYVQADDEFTGDYAGDLDAVTGPDGSNSGSLSKLFNDVHGDPSTGDAVVYYNNNFYIRKKNGKIYIMNEEKKKDK